MLPKAMEEALNSQIRNELESAYIYLSMSAYCEAEDQLGFAQWLRVQAKEELEHAMKIFDHVNDRGGRVLLHALPAPPSAFGSMTELFEQVLKHEVKITAHIHDLYELAQKEFGAVEIDGGPWCKFKNPKTGNEIIVKDVIADAFLQQILLRPAEYSVIATLNLNGDYISDALAAQVGGIGIAPGANLSDTVAMFEATHGTAPKYAGKDYVNPGSEILSAEMMLRHMGWIEAADLIISSMEKSIASKKVTYDFARLMDGATQMSCSGFGQVMIENM